VQMRVCSVPFKRIHLMRQCARCRGARGRGFCGTECASGLLRTTAALSFSMSSGSAFGLRRCRESKTQVWREWWR
jgi:hypothetical protein